MEEFIKEVKAMPTMDIVLILEDQLDLYTEEEIAILKNELASRPENAIELEEEERERIEKLCSEEMEKQRALEAEKQRMEAERVHRERIRQEYNHKMDNLTEMGLDGYYEYKVINLSDNDSGGIQSRSIEETLNSLGLEGWHLRCAYANELGRNSSSNGFGGFSSGTNATIDQNILIFERFVKIKKI